MRLRFLMNSRKVLFLVWAVCFTLGFVAGAWIGPAITGMSDRRLAADRTPLVQTVSSADTTSVQGSSVESQLANKAPAREPETMTMPAEGRTVGAYGWYRDSIMDDWRFRDGLDISCAPGAKVAAALSGIVTDAARARDGGYSVSLKHAGGVNTTYVNLRAVWVDVGQQVAVGEPLGDIGAASSASGGVLRFTVECDGQSKDPAVCLGQRF
ncbi:MAG: peptidoglycan DD-metalloendopeptidase family protein [Bacillota bacterium]|jgi:murein DD-endopeptidase MepM/ murein hydrolase activator NlpD